MTDAMATDIMNGRGTLGSVADAGRGLGYHRIKMWRLACSSHRHYLAQDKEMRECLGTYASYEIAGRRLNLSGNGVGYSVGGKSQDEAAEYPTQKPEGLGQLIERCWCTWVRYRPVCLILA